MAEKEYIDRQSTVDALARLCKRVCQYSEKQRQFMCGACPLGDAFTVIEDDLPAADVRPVVKARWINLTPPKYREAGNSIFWMCSECKSAACFMAEDLPYSFCPNCGAAMEES